MYVLGDFILNALMVDLVAGTETSGVTLSWVRTAAFDHAGCSSAVAQVHDECSGRPAQAASGDDQCLPRDSGSAADF